MPRLTDRSVLHTGLQQAPMLWEQDGFALADGYDIDERRYHGLTLPTDEQRVQITDQTLVVRPDVAMAQRVAESAEAPEGEEQGADDASGGLVDDGGAPSGGAGVTPVVRPQKTRFFASKQLSSQRYAMDFKNVADEVLAHLTSVPGATVRITLEIEATAPDGFDESRARVVSENAATLKFEQSSFEEQ